MFITLHENPGDRPFPINAALIGTYNAFDLVTKNDVTVERQGTLVSCMNGSRFSVKETPEQIEALLQAAGMMAPTE